MDSEELCEHLASLGLPEDAIDMIHGMNLDGASWPVLVLETAAEGAEALAELWSELRINSRMIKSSILTQARLSMIESERGHLKKYRGAFSEFQDPTGSSEDPEVKTNGESDKENSSAGQDQGGGEKPRESSDHTLPSGFPKVHHAPKFPACKSREESGESVSRLQVFGRVLSAWAEPYAPKLASALDRLMERLTEVELTEAVGALSSFERRIDVELGGHLYATAPEVIQRELHDAEKRQLDGRSSALRMIWSWMLIVDDNSQLRITQALTQWLNRKPTQHAADLYEDVQKFKLELDTMCRLGMGSHSSKGEPVFLKLMEQAVDRMISKLSEDKTLIRSLVMPMAMVERENIPAVIDQLEKCALELRHTPRAQSGPTREFQQNRGWSRNRSEGSTAAMAAPSGSTMCFLYRETGKCPRKQKDKCKFSHEGRTGKLCTDKAYVETGLCSEFRTCPACLPLECGEAWKTRGPPSAGSETVGQEVSSGSGGRGIHGVERLAHERV